MLDSSWHLPPVPFGRARTVVNNGGRNAILTRSERVGEHLLLVSPQVPYGPKNRDDPAKAPRQKSGCQLAEHYGVSPVRVAWGKVRAWHTRSRRRREGYTPAKPATVRPRHSGHAGVGHPFELPRTCAPRARFGVLHRRKPLCVPALAQGGAPPQPDGGIPRPWRVPP